MFSGTNKFSITEIFSDETGKTSASAFAGILIIAVSCIGFLIGIFELFKSNTTELISQSSTFAMMGVGLLGLRKYLNGKPGSSVIPEEKIEGV
jgi:hypothetical protein